MEVRQRGLITGILTAVLLVAPFAAEAKRAGGGKSHGMHSLLNLINNLVKLRLLNKRQLPVLQPSKNLVRVSAVWLLRV